MMRSSDLSSLQNVARFIWLRCLSLMISQRSADLQCSLRTDVRLHWLNKMIYLAAFADEPRLPIPGISIFRQCDWHIGGMTICCSVSRLWLQADSLLLKNVLGIIGLLNKGWKIERLISSPTKAQLISLPWITSVEFYDALVSRIDYLRSSMITVWIYYGNAWLDNRWAKFRAHVWFVIRHVHSTRAFVRRLMTS